MLTIIRPGYGKIMQLFYKDKAAKLHLREIARQANLCSPSAFRFLNSLEKDRILHSEREGNLKKYSVRKGARAYYLFEAFDLERFEKLPEIRREAIRTYMDALPKKPIFAVLFGSTAKMTWKEDSDIDILIVTGSRIDTRPAEKETDALTAIRISTFQMTFRNFVIELKMKQDKVVQSAILSGYPLINHISYYEALHERI